MSSTYYTSLSGMIAASYGLQNTSNNIANMQSPGFKRNEVFYSSLGQSGVTVSGHSTNYNAGNYLETGNTTDLAIVGNGFFMVKLKNDELLYTRDGEFGFNKDGVLMDKHSGGIVQGYDKKGHLVPIHQSGSKTNPGKPTHSIDLSGEFVIVEQEKDPNSPENPDPFKSKYENIRFEIVNVFDEKGKPHTIHLEFEAPGMPGSGQNSRDNLEWNLLSATCDDAKISFNPQTIKFNFDQDGTPEQGYNTIRFNLNGNQSVTLNFGDYMQDKNNSVRLYKKNTSDHTSTTIAITKHDGYAEGKATGCSFDDNGQISYHYDNGQSEESIHIALARFDDPEHTLALAHDNLFRAKDTRGRHLGRPNEHGLGTIQPQKIESSNVDSTMEFGNIVVLQRMFQACSQIMDIDKQLLEELEKK
jgi:flagellar hook protein FlgE